MLTATPETDHQAIVPDPNGKRLKILVVDDDPFTLQIIQKRLAKEHYPVLTATNGVEALAQVERECPDLVLSDWMMPELDGAELCSRLKQQYGSRIYFIMLTARDKNEDKVGVLDLGADEYLVKPIDGQELMARLRAAERLMRLQSQLRQSNDELTAANGRINKELRAISHIQRSLLPQSLPDVAGYRFAAHYQPSTECSGDFYDIMPLPDGRIGITIGDVSGHGAPAMVAMALVRMLLHLEAPATSKPSDLLFKINNLMCEHLPTGQFVTMFYGLLDPATGVLHYSSAGHNRPLCLDRAGGDYFLSGCEGYPIKLVGRDLPYSDHLITLARGQTLLLYTDGVIEAFNPDDAQFEEEGLRSSAVEAIELPPAPMIQHIMSSLNKFRREHEFDDDLSLLVIARD
ncbi:SpoIIE family protein phosphatase [bacterium]|nr:SpoIIE family protein phosphatase [bacterium]